MSSATQAKERPLAQPGTDFREGPAAPFSPWVRVLFICFSFCVIFAPRRDTQVREAFTQPLEVRWAASFLLTTRWEGWFCHRVALQTAVMGRVSGIITHSPAKPGLGVSQPPSSSFQSCCWCLGMLSAWLLMASGCCCDSTALAGNFAFNALYFTPRGDKLKLLGHLGAKRRPAESSRSRRSPREMGAVS